MTKRRLASQILLKESDNPSEPPFTYVDRVNRAIDFVIQNLDRKLTLELVAQSAFLSPFHFHRIFKASVGETLNEFIKRIRLDRSLSHLSRTDATRSSMTQIALACGFSSLSDFTRCFRQRYGIAPSKFDVEAFRAENRRKWQSQVVEDRYGYLLDKLPGGANPDGFEVQLRRLPERHVAYVRVPDSYRHGAVPAAAEWLVGWAEKRGLANGQWLGYMWDDPEVVPPEKCRYDVGLVVPGEIREADVSLLRFPEMVVAEVQIRGPIDVEVRALDWLFGTWLPDSGFVPSDQPCFEAWDGRPFQHGMTHFELRIQLPVVALRAD